MTVGIAAMTLRMTLFRVFGFDAAEFGLASRFEKVCNRDLFGGFDFGRRDR